MSDSTKTTPRLKDRLESICVEMIDRGILFSEGIFQFEKCFIAEVLNRNDGNLMRAAENLGIHRNTLAKKIALYKGKRSQEQGARSQNRR
jgi:transcriptional regulator with PAS, ATPase and Fis domain